MINIKMQNNTNRLRPKITVIGVGGAGGNAVNNMIASGLEGCDFLVCNTDAQALEGNSAPHKIQLGVNVTRGLGAGANPEIGRAAAEESIDDIMGYLEGSNMVFVTAGMGGGTGTGAAAVIAEVARNAGILTVGVVTKPFHFEGTHRMKLAENGINALQKNVDTLIIIPNQNLFRIANEKTTFSDAFQMADEVLQSGVRGVTDLMVMPGLINLDFADIRAVMAEMGKAMMGTGEAEGDRRAVEAAEKAISNPLLDDVSMKGARGVLINITGGLDMTLFEVDEAANRIRDEVDPDANIIFGSTFDQTLQGKMRVSVVATGIDVEAATSARPLHLSGAPVDAMRRPVTQQQQAPRVQRQASVTAGGYGGYAGYETAQKSRAVAPDMGVQAGIATSGAGIPAAMIPSMPASSGMRPMASAPVRSPMAQQAGTVIAQTTMAPVSGGTSPAEAPVMAEQQPATGHAAPAPAGYAATATARKMDEMETEQTWSRPATPPVTQNYQRAVPSAAQPRGTRMGDSFIPPRPVDPRASGNADLFSADDFVAPDTSEPVAEKAVKKSPSLFERFTMQREKEKVAAPAVRTEGHMTVTDGGKSDGEDELDIPAFLRRQAN